LGNSKSKSLTVGVTLTVLVIAAVVGTAVWLLSLPIPTPADYRAQNYDVQFDEWGIPTVSAPDWTSLIEEQGFVVASERLFQMDLIRRQAGGRLSELFGAKAVVHDASMRMEDREGVAERSVPMLPTDERATCEAYTAGVNRFIASRRSGWSTEYTILRSEPEPWSCKDTLLVVLSMNDMLTSTSSRELIHGLWSERLDADWAEFLFTYEHPWNPPLFGTKSPDGVKFPPIEKFIPMRPLAMNSPSSKQRIGEDDQAVGSNGWAWNGPTGTFLANDTHLGQNVPGIWYAMRLRVDRSQWVVGVTIPGLPGIVLGMNRHHAWGFTNTGEDVDDLLEETISPDGQNYLAAGTLENPQWEPIIRKMSVVRIKGGGEQKVEAKFTRRGPLQKYDGSSDKLYSRQWLGLRDGLLRIPISRLNASQSWEEINAVLDNMKLPAQNVMIADRNGNLGYRVAGTGPLRQPSGLGRVPVKGPAGEWLGLEPPEQRRRLLIPADPNQPTSLVTANQRIWIDDYGHEWYSEDRAQGIRDRLAGRTDLTAEDMLSIQLDTTSRFRKLLLNWVARHANPTDPGATALTTRWSQWNGNADADQRTFTDSVLVDKELTSVLIGRVREAFLPEKTADFEYRWALKRAWQIALLERENGMQIFGLNDAEVANHLLKHALARQGDELYSRTNKWKAQHPFVAAVPVLGRLFAVKEFDQVGFADLVRAESPKFGPAKRLIWDLRNPQNSKWILPVGQSGHVASKHYKDQQDAWNEGRVLPVFSSSDDFDFSP